MINTKTNRESGEQIAQRTHRREAEVGHDALQDRTTAEAQNSETVSLKLLRLKQRASENPGRVFTSLHHLIDVEFLREAYRRTNKTAAVGVDKEDGTQRPLGIPAFEDKILQEAVAMVLSAIYEVDFYNFSYGVREKRSAHMALKELRDGCMQRRVSVILDADVSQFFDHMSQSKR